MEGVITSSQKRLNSEEESSSSKKPKKMPSSLFYGNLDTTTLHSEWKARLSSLRVNHSKEIFKEFPKQKLAFQYLKELTQNGLELEPLFVFAEEYPHKVGSGGRKYMVATLAEIWKRKTSLDEKGMEWNAYEVIPEGDCCKLYYDLEYHYKFNPNLDVEAGEQMVSNLIDETIELLHSMFNIRVSKDEVIELDSSTPEKFSHHLIFNISTACFKDNIHCGQFVRTLIANTSKNSNSGIPPFHVMKDHSQTTFLADMGVYTRNRNFRVYGATKVGKKTPLKLCSRCQFKFTSEEDLFRSSLIANIPLSSKIRILECGTEIQSPSKSSPQKSVISPPSNRPTQREATEGVIEGENTSSPFPLVDEFIKTQINRGGVDGEIRNWVYFQSSQLLIYNIAKNRFCENIGRGKLQQLIFTDVFAAHKSNHIFIVCSLAEGVYFQKCHDPVCRSIDFRSNERPLPLSCCPAFPSSDWIDQDQYLLKDNELLDLIEQGEL